MNAGLGRLKGAWDLATGSVWMHLHYHTPQHSNIGISQDSLEKEGEGGEKGRGRKGGRGRGVGRGGREEGRREKGGGEEWGEE